MEMRMFGFLILSGLCDVGFPSNQYYFRKDSTTWLEAQQFCRKKQGDLAAVNDLQDLEKLAGLIEDSNPVVFLGLRRQWAWSVSDADEYREGEPAYWNWADNNEPSGEACGTIGLSGKWFSSSCSSLMHFFCYSASSTNISRFYLEERSMNWSDAQAFCRGRYTDLAWVHNEQENQALQDVSKKHTVWIGLSRKSWRWSDGSEATFVPWKTLPLPYGDCGALDLRNKTPGIVQTNCAGKASFLCSRGPLRKQWMRLKLIADDLLMWDPEVTKSLLKMIEMRLRNAGVSEDVKLSWWKCPEKEDEMEQKTTQEHKMCLFNDSYVLFS